jgi:chromosome segregation ATPase
MTQASDVDIQELKDLITRLDRKIDVGFANVDTKFSEVRGEIKDARGDIKTLDARLNNLESNTKSIADLAEKVGELKNWKQIAIVIFTATVGGAIGWFVKTGN